MQRVFQVGLGTPAGFGAKPGMIPVQIQFFVFRISIYKPVGSRKKQAGNQHRSDGKHNNSL